MNCSDKIYKMKKGIVIRNFFVWEIKFVGRCFSFVNCVVVFLVFIGVFFIVVFDFLMVKFDDELKWSCD